MARIVPPDEQETAVVVERGGGAAPPPAGPPPDRGFGWGLVLGVLAVVAAAAVGTAIWFALRGGSASDTTAVTTAGGPPTTTALTAPPKVVVPAVTGLREDKAAATLAAAGLEPRVTLEATPKPDGTVVSQSPSAGGRAGHGSAVTIVVDRGAPVATVPDVRGLALPAARKRLDAVGLRVATTPYTSTKPAGTVVDESPKGGSKLRHGGVVTLSVAHRPPHPAPTTTAAITTTTTGSATAPSTTTTAPPQPATVTVPDVTGQLLADAADTLQQAGLYPNVVYIPSDQPLGTVVQEARQGATAQRGTYVRVNVSKTADPAPDTTVPNVRGRSRLDAMHAVSAAGFQVKVLERPVSSATAPDTVLDEQPSAGARIPHGVLVILVVGTRQGG